MPEPVVDSWRRDKAYVVDLAFRMLGNISDAEDVVQEAFVRLLRQDVTEIADVRGWLAVVVTRLCLDQLRSAKRRRVVDAAPDGGRALVPDPRAPDPADRVTLDDNIRLALIVVLEQLGPAERAVFVLHDVFQFSFESISSIVGRSPAACRQIASRARRRLRNGVSPSALSADLAEQQRVARQFIDACAGGDLQALLRVLDDDVVGDVDLGTAIRVPPQRGAVVIAPRLLRFYGPDSGTALVSQPVNGDAGVLAFTGGRLVGMLRLRAVDGRVVDIHAIADPVKLGFVDTSFGQ